MKIHFWKKQTLYNEHMWILEIHDNSDDMKNRFSSPPISDTNEAPSQLRLWQRPHLCNWARKERKKRNPTGDDMIFTVQGNTGIQWLISSSGNPEKKITQTTRSHLFCSLFICLFFKKPVCQSHLSSFLQLLLWDFRPHAPQNGFIQTPPNNPEDHPEMKPKIIQTSIVWV